MPPLTRRRRNPKSPRLGALDSSREWASGVSTDGVTFRSPTSVLRPGSVAMVGASERGQWQRLMYSNLRDYNYPGRVFLVNPRQQEVYGQRTVRSLFRQGDHEPDGTRN